MVHTITIGKSEENTPENITGETQQKDMNTNRIAVNNEQKEDPNYKSNREEPNENSATCTR